MNQKTMMAVLVWIDLSATEKKEFDSVTRTWQQGDNREREEMARKVGDALASIDLGPLTAACRSCGR